MPMSEIANVLKESLGDKAKKVPPASCPTGSSGSWGCLIAGAAARAASGLPAIR